MAEIREAVTDEEVAATYTVMSQLHPHLVEEEYVGRVRRMREESGYSLVSILEDEYAMAVAGYRISEFLAHGKRLHIDDLVTDEAYRRGGYGKLLFDWLVERARSAGCTQLRLDSGVSRPDTHRFYFREKMRISSYHFALEF